MPTLNDNSDFLINGVHLDRVFNGKKKLLGQLHTYSFIQFLGEDDLLWADIDDSHFYFPSL